MADIPTISITREDTIENDDDDNDTDGGDIANAHTDVEDLDSDDNLRRAKSPMRQLKLRRQKCKRISNAATDIEDYNDSDSDDEKNNDDDQYEAEISLTEFLDQGYVDEASSSSKTNRRGFSQNLEHQMNRLGIQDDCVGGSITDCENIETSGDEGIGSVATTAQYENFLVDNQDDNTICIQNSVTKGEKPLDKPQIVYDSVGSDSELDQPSERRCRIKKTLKTRNLYVYDLSDVENIMFTDDDDPVITENHPSDGEEIILESSENETNDESKSCPPQNFDITFADGHSTFGLRNRKHKSGNVKPSSSKNALSVAVNDDEGCTDVENLDSSDNDDDDEDRTVAKNRLYIPTAYVKSDQLPMTDVEDFGSDDDESLQENTFRSEIKMPSPVREMTFTKENATGARMSKVMPMNGNLFLGIDDSYIDKGMTDTEEMSGKEEDYCDATKYVIESLPAIDGGVTSNSEFYLQNKKTQSELESITDTEAVTVNRSGVRRKKMKARNSKKSRNYLEPKCVADLPLTDTEDIFMDDDQCGQRKKTVTPTYIQLVAPSINDGLTDVESLESLSGDEKEDYKKTNEAIDAMEMEALVQESFFSTVTSHDISNSENVKIHTIEMPATVRKPTPIPDKSYLTATDTEEMQLISDIEDQGLEVPPSRDESVTPELHTLLGDGDRSTIYHQNLNRFDMCNERHYIKGYKECQEANTDVEYLDDDGNAQNDACKNESKRNIFNFYYFISFSLCSVLFFNANNVLESLD